jgi:hypothetical protein
MRRLQGGIPRGRGNHRSRMAIQYRRYCLAMVARYGPLPADAARWLKEAGLLTLSLDQLHAEVESARAVLTNGAGRRAREKVRVQLRQFERSRLRASLEAAEKRLEALATGQGQDLARAMEMNAASRLEANLLRVAPRT